MSPESRRVVGVPLVVLLAVLITTQPGGAQSARTAGIADEVRVAYECGDGASRVRRCVARGEITRLARDTMVIGELALSRFDVRGVEVPAGKRSRWREGALVGFVTGSTATLLTLSGVFSYGTLCDPTRDDDALGWPACVAVSAGVGVVTGGIGAAIGSAFRTTRWREASVRMP